MRELELIAELRSLLGAGGPRVVRGLGDDAAVVRGRGYAVTSVDTMVDGVHFRSGELAPGEIGHRALAGALSDLAAMGAPAGEAYLALGLPPGTELDSARALITGAAELARQLGVTIAGGDVTAAPALVVSFTVVGWVEDPGELVGRDGGAPGRPRRRDRRARRRRRRPCGARGTVRRRCRRRSQRSCANGTRAHSPAGRRSRTGAAPAPARCSTSPTDWRPMQATSRARAASAIELSARRGAARTRRGRGRRRRSARSRPLFAARGRGLRALLLREPGDASGARARACRPRHGT